MPFLLMESTNSMIYQSNLIGGARMQCHSQQLSQYKSVNKSFLKMACCSFVLAIWLEPVEPVFQLLIIWLCFSCTCISTIMMATLHYL